MGKIDEFFESIKRCRHHHKSQWQRDGFSDDTSIKAFEDLLEIFEVANSIERIEYFYFDIFSRYKSKKTAKMYSESEMKNNIPEGMIKYVLVRSTKIDTVGSKITDNVDYIYDMVQDQFIEDLKLKQILKMIISETACYYAFVTKTFKLVTIYEGEYIDPQDHLMRIPNKEEVAFIYIMNNIWGISDMIYSTFQKDFLSEGDVKEVIQKAIEDNIF